MELPTEVKITSHRPILGKFIVLYKKLIKLIIAPYLESVFTIEHQILDEERFNFVEERFKNDNEKIIRIEKRLDGHDNHFRHFDERSGNIEGRLAHREKYVDERIMATTTDILKHIEHVFKSIGLRIDSQNELLGVFGKKIDEKSELLDKRRKFGHIFLRKKMESLLSGSLKIDGSKDIKAVITNKLQENLMEFDYLTFEDTYRNTCIVSDMQKQYISYFKGKKNVLDMGCGRGEFLSLLKDEGIDAYGVDMNEPMSLYCKQQKLKVMRADAIEHLTSLEDSSLEGVFSAHLIEHIPKNKLPGLLNLCYAKLKNSSFLVLETPNITSLVTFADSFYKDLSHETPLHPDALSFLLESVGFKSVEKKFLSPYPDDMKLKRIDIPEDYTEKEKKYLEKMNLNIDHLNNILYGYLDYAVIARK